MAGDPYATIAPVYEWLLPESVLTPEGCVAAFREPIGKLSDGARVLDCACGIGQLAVGLALEGFRVTATDASPAMVKRTRALAADRGVDIATAACAWEELPGHGWSEAFDAAFCVGNSLTHAPGRDARRQALRQMAAVLRSGGLLVVTSRNWELVRERGPGLSIVEELVERAGALAIVTHAWTIASGADDPCTLDVAVAIVGEPPEVGRRAARLVCWPFARAQLEGDLRAAGLEPTDSTYSATAERYSICARRQAR